ncbi:chromate transporter [Oceanirhabdus seepicola]|uniref:Chromate transporter n=1 Tax=Oceanirhabdus seepicola TaxID=2828781 RepID=A0A9J6NXN0_9CLOT|nr:chromate transporter [Oceanirhabdus seepicola]MCM1989263.1 chromate transporter [Oceanirhabdus seepicola]
MLFNIFLIFAKLSMFCFGGGYVMIPIILEELEKNGWATAAEVIDVVAIAGMSPGPIVANAAVGFGYKIAGVPGVLAALLGITIPCGIIVIVVAKFFLKFYENDKIQSALYGIRAVITGIIFFAAVKLALENGIIGASENLFIKNGYNIFVSSNQLFELKSIIIIVLSFLALLKTKIHPIFIICIAGGVGLFLF